MLIITILLTKRETQSKAARAAAATRLPPEVSLAVHYDPEVRESKDRYYKAQSLNDSYSTNEEKRDGLRGQDHLNIAGAILNPRYP